MPSNERDPRRDPRPGDVVVYGPQWQRERVEVVGRSEIYVAYKGLAAMVFTCLLTQWQQWTDSAEVLHVAE
jgi:hypothetical protein